MAALNLNAFVGAPADDGVEAGPGSNSSSDDEPEGHDGEGASGGGFLAGQKSASFAKAFAKIMEAPGGGTSSTAAQGVAAAPILAASKSLARRQAEEEAEAKHDREAKRLRLEMKQRGHAMPTRRGVDPAADAREKALQRLATKGVVRLFNAVTKAQKQLRDAEEATGSKARAAKLGKASFLAELKGAASKAGSGAAQPLVPTAPSRAAAAAAGAPAKKHQQRQQQQRQQAADSSDDEAVGWDVLKQGFSGLQSGSKMKDWDKQQSEDEGGEGGPGDVSSSEDEDEEGGW